jgi:hypothetical protein
VYVTDIVNDNVQKFGDLTTTTTSLSRTSSFMTSSVTTYALVHVSSIPNGIVYWIPVVITNSQSSPTPAHFEQMFMVDSAVYASYEAPNLQNVEFFNADGTIIPSWLESGSTSSSTNTIYWLKLPIGIAPYSSMVVYMGFASPSRNLFNAQATGEAAQLSTVYGKYDDGAKVFDNYVNFAGATLPAGWSPWRIGSGSITVNNGLTVATAAQTGSGAAAISNIQSSSGIIEGYISSFSNGYNSNIEAMVASTSSTGFNYLPNCIGWQNGQQLEIENNNGGTPSVVATSSIDATAPFILGVQGNSLYVNYSQGATISGGILGHGYLSIEDSSGTTIPTITYDWVRTRVLPPNGVMPTATINGQTQTLPSVQSSMTVSNTTSTTSTSLTFLGATSSPASITATAQNTSPVLSPISNAIISPSVLSFVQALTYSTIGVGMMVGVVGVFFAVRRSSSLAILVKIGRLDLRLLALFIGIGYLFGLLQNPSSIYNLSVQTFMSLLLVGILYWLTGKAEEGIRNRDEQLQQRARGLIELMGGRIPLHELAGRLKISEQQTVDLIVRINASGSVTVRIDGDEAVLGARPVQGTIAQEGYRDQGKSLQGQQPPNGMTPQPASRLVIKEQENIPKSEKLKCKYCENLYDQKEERCPYCHRRQ